MEVVTLVVQYLSTYLDHFGSDSLAESDLLNLLGGDGGCHVHAVFYCICDSMAKLSQLCGGKSRFANQ